jgi:methylated-DNA-[protein]-cysteine S-methyltransferase
MNFFDNVHRLCKEIPEGKVSSYKEIAKKLNSKAYRLVGRALKENIDFISVPCYRVVGSNGQLIGFKGSIKFKELNEKTRLLEKEGIKIKNGKVLNLDEVFYNFE